MIFRYFDQNGKPLTTAQLKQMEITTPVMEHVFVSVLKRVCPSDAIPVSSSKTLEAVES